LAIGTKQSFLAFLSAKQSTQPGIVLVSFDVAELAPTNLAVHSDALLSTQPI
jgi:hypothetical protein